MGFLDLCVTGVGNSGGFFPGDFRVYFIMGKIIFISLEYSGLYDNTGLQHRMVDIIT